MKANEIRFGNIFNFEDDSLFMSCYGVVISIKEKHGRWRSITNANLGYEQDDNYIDFEPIELTPEILEKCGFVKPAHSYIGDIFHLSEWDEYPLNWCVAMNKNNAVIILKLKHLHQLQNLYFALTGEELEVKL